MFYWLLLVIAAVLEVCWMYCVKYMDFAKIKQIPWGSILGEPSLLIPLLPLIGYILFGISNVVCFSNATKGIPMSLAFGVWMSLALIGSKVVDTLFLGESLSYRELIYMSLILIGIIGLKTEH